MSFLFLKEPAFKPTQILTVEQQRERERQRLRDEEERRKKLAVRKDHQQTAQAPPVPKFEPLSVDMNNDETRTNKSKTPTIGTGTFSPHFPLTNGATNKLFPKPSSITPVPRPANQDENDPNANEAGATAALVPTSVPKKFIIKKRSSTLVRRIHSYFECSLFFFSILPPLLSLINMSWGRKWVTETSLLFIVRNYEAPSVNMRSKSSINPR